MSFIWNDYTVREVVGRGVLLFFLKSKICKFFTTHIVKHGCTNGERIVSVLKKTLHSSVTLQHIFLFQFLETFHFYNRLVVSRSSAK
jgi:hypothetical protein